MKNILFLASEAVPFIKTGGLADVVGSLPKTIDHEYYDCRVMIPKYLCIPWGWREKMEYVTHFYMDYLGQSRYVGVMSYRYEGVLYYFIDNESYFSGDRPYGDWLWDLEKFCFFCYAALSAFKLSSGSDPLPRLADESRTGASEGPLCGRRILPLD